MGVRKYKCKGSNNIVVTYFVLSVSLGRKTRGCFFLLLLKHIVGPIYNMLDIYKKEKFH